MGSVSRDHAAVDLALAPIHPPARQLVAGLEGTNVLLTVAGGLGVQGPDDLCAVPPIAGPMRDPGFRTAETAGRPLRMVAFVPGVAHQDQLAADIAGRKLGVATTAIVERLSGRGGKSAARVGEDGHGDFHREVCGLSKVSGVEAAAFSDFFELRPQ